MSLATARIYCTISSPLSGAIEDCSIVLVQQLQMFYRRRCCMSASETHNVRLTLERSRRSRASETRRQSWARYDDEMSDSDRWTSVATLKSTVWRTTIASVADGASALCGLNVEYQ